MSDNDITDDGASFYQLTERYPDEASAIRYFEEKRWPKGPHCLSCGSVDVFKGKRAQRLPRWECRDCGKQFTVTSGTVMENTKLPLRKWLWAFHELGGAKHGVSSRALARKLSITLKSAWHLSHRVRATMKEDSQFFSGGIVESDETYIGGKRRGRGRGYRGNKMAVQTIVERRHGGKKRGKRYSGDCENECPGRAQTIALDQQADKVDGRTVGAKLRVHTDPETTRLMTDESPIYDKPGEAFKSHETVNHAKGEYARTDPYSGRLVSTNAAEGLFANLKRQITGTHHSTSKKHLPRYLEEYDHKYNRRHLSDTAITDAAVKNIEGRRVTLFKSESGEGESLIDTKAGEKRKHGTRRGMHTRSVWQRRKRRRSFGSTGRGRSRGGRTRAGRGGRGRGAAKRGVTKQKAIRYEAHYECDRCKGWFDATSPRELPAVFDPSTQSITPAWTDASGGYGPIPVGHATKCGGTIRKVSDA